MRALTAFIKPFWGTTKKCENKNLLNFYSLNENEQVALGLLGCVLFLCKKCLTIQSSS